MDTISDFSSLPLPAAVKAALESQGITVPSPIQAQAIPVAMQGRDVVGLAQTGTGKTLAFCLPLITALDKAENDDATALILAPTREIAIQVTEVIKALTVEMKGRWTPLLVIGGVGMQPQIDGLKKKPRLIVATPGRLVDHMREGVAKLDTVSFLVLDEADRMLDMGFAPQLNEILRGLPKTRQTMLFSATFPREIEEISSKYLNSPERIEAGAGHSKVVDSVSQSVKELNEGDKFEALLSALAEREGTIIVFVRTKHRTERLAKQLEKHGHSAGRIHGDRSQSQRQNTLGAFKEGKIRILVATDIAARGIDVANVAHVINYDIPNVPEEYIHRIGRTGRAGATGDALTFVTPEVVEEWYDIQKLVNPEEARKMPRPRNAPKPDKPQHGGRHDGGRHDGGRHDGGRHDGGRHEGGRHEGGRHDRGQRDGAPRNDRPRDDRPRNDRPRNDRPRDDRPRDDRPRHDSGRHDSGRQEGRPERGNQGRDNRQWGSNRQESYGNQGNSPVAAKEHTAGNQNEYDNEEDFHPQPTLEEQLTRIDREGRARNNNRGGPSRGNPNNRGAGPSRGGPGARDDRPRHGGPRDGSPRDGGPNRGGPRNDRPRDDRPRDDRPRHQADPGNHTRPAQVQQSRPAEDGEDNVGNRDADGNSTSKKSGFMSWFKK